MSYEGPRPLASPAEREASHFSRLVAGLGQGIGETALRVLDTVPFGRTPQRMPIDAWVDIDYVPDLEDRPTEETIAPDEDQLRRAGLL